MKYIILGAWAILFLSFGGCADPGSNPGTNPGTGGHVTDSTVQPGPATGGKSHPYSERDNLLDPNHIEFLSDPDRSLPQPFNAPFVQANNIRRITFSHYNAADNTLDESNTEAQLESSGSKTYEFDEEGRLLRWVNNRLMDGTSLQNISVTNSYNSFSNLSEQNVTGNISAKEISGTTTFSYDATARITSRVDPIGVSKFYGYDLENAHIYELQSTPGGGNSVHVTGKPGDFPNATCLSLQDEILSLGSPFVPYAKAPGIVRNVFFYEKSGRKTVRQVNMGKNGEIDGEIVNTYNSFANLENSRLNWEDAGALFKSEKVLRYLPSNDPDRVVVKQLRQQGESKTTVYHFTFGPEGRLEKMIESTKVDNDPEVIESIDFVRYEIGQAVAQPGEAVPGGTN
jgi:YD repeat-containing protein